jgi:hypothetical protein
MEAGDLVTAAAWVSQGGDLRGVGMVAAKRGDLKAAREA